MVFILEYLLVSGVELELYTPRVIALMSIAAVVGASDRTKMGIISRLTSTVMVLPPGWVLLFSGSIHLLPVGKYTCRWVAFGSRIGATRISLPNGIDLRWPRLLGRRGDAYLGAHDR